MVLRALVIWCGLLAIAFATGLFRSVWLAAYFGDAGAHIAAALILCSIVAIVAWRAIEWLHPRTANEALLIGDEWVLLSIAFQVVAGFVLVGTPWQWELLLVTMLLMPMVAALSQHLVAPIRSISAARKAFFGR